MATIGKQICTDVLWKAQLNEWVLRLFSLF